jgi:hypothetical protein
MGEGKGGGGGDFTLELHFNRKWEQTEYCVLDGWCIMHVIRITAYLPSGTQKQFIVAQRRLQNYTEWKEGEKRKKRKQEEWWG